MLLTETGAIPLLSDNTTNLAKSIGKIMDGYEVKAKYTYLIIIFFLARYFTN